MKNDIPIIIKDIKDLEIQIDKIDKDLSFLIEQKKKIQKHMKDIKTETNEMINNIVLDIFRTKGLKTIVLKTEAFLTGRDNNGWLICIGPFKCNCENGKIYGSSDIVEHIKSGDVIVINEDNLNATQVKSSMISNGIGIIKCLKDVPYKVKEIYKVVYYPDYSNGDEKDKKLYSVIWLYNSLYSYIERTSPELDMGTNASLEDRIIVLGGKRKIFEERMIFLERLKHVLENN